MGISEATFYNWKNKYGGFGVAEVRRLKYFKIMRKTIFWGAVTLWAVIILTCAWYFYVWHFQSQSNDGDVIVVFCGNLKRIKAGINLATHNKRKPLVLSPATTEKIVQYREKWPPARAINFVVENQARTTFENALYCSRLIKKYDWKKVILATSNYHMPRSFLLLSLMLLGSKAEVQCFQVDSRRNSWRMKLKEWCAVWYSLGEMTYYIFTGEVPQRSPKQIAREYLLGFLSPATIYRSKRK